jgi:hypothetical protein
MLLALDNDLRKKVSSSDIDPVITDLNRKLGEARERMQQAASAAEESWDKAQQESNVVFRKLQTSVAEITKELKRSFGLDAGQK